MVPVRRNQNWLPSIFNDFLGNDWLAERHNTTAPAVNIIEDENEYKVEVAAPGMTKEDFKVHINEDNELIVTMEKKAEQKEEEDKKKTDNDRIKEWREKIDEINNTIADNKEAGKDAIFGSDIKSAIDDFANAYAEAWSAGEDKAQSAKDLVRKMIRNMVTESIKAAASDPMKEIREKLLEFWSDDYISDWEQDYLDRKAQELADDLDRKFGWADKYFNTGNAVEEDDGRTALVPSLRTLRTS